MANSSSSNWQRPLIAWGALVLVVASLYFAKGILIPIVLAILFTFILSPAVRRVERIGIPRTPAVIIVVLLTSCLFVGIGWAVTAQLQALVGELPAHRDTIVQKVSSLKHGNGFAAGLANLIEDVGKELDKADPTQPPNGPADLAVPVVVKDAGTGSRLQLLSVVAGHIIETLASAALVVALVIFMLIYREDLRNRAIRIAGLRSLTSTTRAIDEAGQRISRFLVLQLLVNVCFGGLLSVGLFAVGVPYPSAWGLIIGLLRFVPYVGTWLGAAMLMLFSVAVFPGWKQPLLTWMVFLALELTVANAVEPWFFGHGTGISPVTVLVTAAFWTWLWGPIGLILSMPIAVCLVVLGKYVPELEIFEILLGDGRGLKREVSFYQRLLARDRDEAADLVEEYLQTRPLDTVYDDVLLPALRLAKRDRERGELSPDDEHWLIETTSLLLDDLPPQKGQDTTGQHQGPNAEVPTAQSNVLVLGCAAQDAYDELALRMLRQVVGQGSCQFHELSAKTLAAEAIARVQGEQPALIVVTALPPGGIAQTRYLCKRLRMNFPEVKILVGRWGQTDHIAAMRERLTNVGIDHVATTLLETVSQITPLLQFFSHAEAKIETVAGKRKPIRNAG